MEENLKSIIDDMKNHQKTSDITMNKIMSLKDGDIIVIEAENDIVNILQLCKIQITAYKNLFVTVKFNNIPEIDELFDYNRFIEEYAALLASFDSIEKLMFDTSLGKDVHKYLLDNFKYEWNVSNTNNILTINILERKKGIINDTTSK